MVWFGLSWVLPWPARRPTRSKQPPPTNQSASQNQGTHRRMPAPDSTASGLTPLTPSGVVDVNRRPASSEAQAAGLRPTESGATPNLVGIKT
jgi:hypothetical protein